MPADIDKLVDELENEYDVDVSKTDGDTLRLENVGSDVNINDVAKFASVRGFNVYPVGEDGERIQPDYFTVERGDV